MWYCGSNKCWSCAPNYDLFLGFIFIFQSESQIDREESFQL